MEALGRILDWITTFLAYLILLKMTGIVDIIKEYLLTCFGLIPAADHSSSMPPDSVSSLFPDRPIRPLPKRRLRERLSPEVASTIKYPPSTHDTVPLFYYPSYNVKDEISSPHAGSTSPIEHTRRGEAGRNYALRSSGHFAGEGDEDETSVRSSLVNRSTPDILSRGANGQLSRPDYARHSDPQPPPSTTSSVDGYESFENTNNKKKRKIPSAGDSTLNGVHSLNSDINSLALSGGPHSPSGEHGGDRSYSNSAGYPGSGSYMSSSQGMSGSGRGRLGRSRNGRSPLRVLSDGNSSWIPRTPKQTTPQWSQTDHPNSGIISSAIANAEKLPAQGQENVSLLEQHSTSNKTTPASSQFTFTCDSQVPGTQWPGHSRYNSGNQTMAGEPSGTNAGHGLGSQHPGQVNGEVDKEREDRIALNKELKAAARFRRKETRRRNRMNPPRPEDVWICEFCEYRSIFGKWPRVLVRNYEKKDRDKRNEEADRKRLLEKAKAKSRKSKKNGKAAAKGAHSTAQGSDNVDHYGQQDLDGAPDPLDEHEAAHMHLGHSHSTQSDDYDHDHDHDIGGHYLESPDGYAGPQGGLSGYKN